MSEARASNTENEQINAIEDSGTNLGRHQSVATEKGFDAILARVQDPESQPAEICRLIALEIAMVTKRMVSRRFTVDDDYILEGCAKQVAALRELGKQVLLAEVWRKKEDVLNFDGEKFKFVAGTMIDFFKKAMKEAGVEENLRATVMRLYRDILGINEDMIRRETAKLGTNKSTRSVRRIAWNTER